MRRDRVFERQDELYRFPYHWLPHFDADGALRIHRELTWAFDYMTYMTHVVHLITELAPQSMCDVGCGDGRLLQMAGPYVPQISGVDVSDRAIQFAKAFNPHANVRCIDISDVSETFDLITLVEVLEHIPNEMLPGFVEAVAARLESGGRLILTVPTTNVPTSRKHHRHFDLDSLHAVLTPWFTIERHWWLSRLGIMEWVLRRVVANPLFVLRNGAALRLAWRLHKRYCYFGGERNAIHLACVARPNLS